MQNHDVFARILRTTLILLGVWAMYAQTSVFLGRSFNQLVTGSWIPFLAIVFLMFCFRKSRLRKDDAGEQFIDVGNRTVLFLGVASIAGMLIFRPGNPISALIYAIAVLIALSRIGDSVTASTVPAENLYNKKQRWIVIVVMLASMIIALCEHRVNWDDAKYLHIVASTLDHPNEPMLVYDNLHGVKGLKVYHPSVQLQTYELLVATISRVFAVNHLHVYYLILPPLWAALSVLAQWILIRRIAGKYAPPALVATFVMLALWGGHRSYGSFAFDFVGRGIFLTFAVPSLISAGLDFVETATVRKWLLLFLSAWTGCLLTSTAYAVAPVAVFLVLISCYGLSIQRLREFAFGTLAVLWCPLVLGYVTFVAPIVTPVDVDTPGNVHTVFKGGQGRIALILFGLAPFFALFAKLQSARWLLRYVALSSVVLFSGIFLNWIGTHSSILSWRLLWAIPVPAIVGVGLSAAISFLIERWIPEGGLRSAGTLLSLAIVAFIFSISGSTVVFRNFGWPAVKMDKTVVSVVQTLVNCSNPDDQLLAPPQIAVPIAGFRDAPSLVGARGHHLAYLSAQWGREETVRRKRLFNIVQGDQNSPDDIAWAKDQLRSGSINRVILKRGSNELEPMREMLRSLEAENVVFKNWEIWAPNSSPEDVTMFRSCLLSSNAKAQ